MSDIREGGYVPIADYGVIGDGRSVALVARDGSIDGWGAPSIDTPPVFDRLLDAGKGGRFALHPEGEYDASHKYDDGSNVLITTFTTPTGKVRVTDSLNSGAAGRLPWTELGRRIECVEGSVAMTAGIHLSPLAYSFSLLRKNIYVDGTISLGIISDIDSLAEHGSFVVQKGDKRVIGIVVGENSPLTLPALTAIDARIDRSNDAWKEWSATISGKGEYADALTRSMLALKFLLYSPSGAIAASATAGLPERIGGDKNFDYRFSWVRDTAYTIKAMIRAGLTEEVHAALTWLVGTVDRNGLSVFYTLAGEKGQGTRELPYAGYRGSKPVLAGNGANGQLQLGMYGDIIETVHLYATKGNYINTRTAVVVERLADDCMRKWRKKDAGIWELETARHYTISKIGCWLALDKAVALVDGGYLPNVDIYKRDKWARERDRIIDYIEKRCWNKKLESYSWYAGSKGLDASLMLATRFGYPNKERLSSTLTAIERDLKHGADVYRYSGARDEEGAFTACAYWLVEGYAFLGRRDDAKKYMRDVMKSSMNSLGLMSEMTDPATGELLGNMPQGLSHLTMVHAIDAIRSTGHKSGR